MEHKEQYLQLIQGNLPQNNLLVLEWSLAQFQGDAERALQWIIEKHVHLATHQQAVEFFSIGELVVQFQLVELLDSRTEPSYFSNSYGEIISYKIFRDKKLIFQSYGQALEYAMHGSPLKFQFYQQAILEKLELLLPTLVREIYLL